MVAGAARWPRRFLPLWPLSVLIMLAISTLAAPVRAEVTYRGDQGVSARIFFSHPDNSGVDHCTACHHSSLGTGSRQSAPLGVDFDNYSDAISGTNDTLGNTYVQSGFMPFSQADLSSTLMALMQDWIDDGSLERAQPTLATSSAISIGKYSATLRGSAKENGDNASIDFEYDDDSNLDSGASNSSNVAVPGSGGGGTELAASLSRSVSGLLCGTQYWYRTRASTSFYGFTEATDDKTFTTDPCPVITNPPVNEPITEGITKQHNANSNDGSVTFSLIGAPGDMSVNPSTGVISWTPDEVLGSGSVTLRIFDGTTADTVDFVWTVTPVNDNNPVAVADGTFNFNEDSSNNAIDVLANDSDADSQDTLTIISVTDPANGTTSTDGSQAFYTPDTNFVGSDSFSYTIDDEKGDTASAMVSITIDNQNDPPVAVDDAFTVDEDSGTTAIDVLLNDTDLDSGDTKEVTSVGAGSDGGTITINGTGPDNFIDYAPAPDFNGIETFTYTMEDGGGLSDSGTVTMTVDPVNDPPLISSTAPTTATEDQQYQYQVVVNDPDDVGLGSGIAASLANEPAGMSVDANGLVTWTPGEGVTTSGTVTVSVEDGDEDSSAPDSEQFTITVTSVNDPPAITPAPPSARQAQQGYEYTYTVVINDPDDVNDGTGISFSLDTAPTGMTISPTGAISWPATDTGALSVGDVRTVTVSVEDGDEDSSPPVSDTWNITIGIPDRDLDSVADDDDNCPDTTNAGQQDTDGDGDGDACDPDDNGDGIFDSSIDFTVSQNGQNGIFLAQGAGTVTVNAALAPEINGVDPIWSWSGTTAAIRTLGSYDASNPIPATSTSGGEGVITFDPMALAVGQHNIDLVVTTGSLSTHSSIVVDVRTGASAPADDDNDAVPDSMDGFVGSSVINGTGDGSMAQWLESAGSVRLRVGPDALAAAAGRTPVDSVGALISGSEAQALVGNFGQFGDRTNTGGWFDFEVRGVTPGGSARVVLPLQNRLRPDAVYMKFHPGTGWQEFSTADSNAIASAIRDGGMCPGPNDAVWTSGLAAFDECIRLTLTDGGPNDTDGEVNGVIMDPGGAVAAGDDTENDDPVGGGGGGFGIWSLLTLMLGSLTLILFGWRRKDERA